MSEPMTLEQVRDALYARTGNGNKVPDKAFCKRMADAIDAHLAQPAQVVDENSVNQALRDPEVEIATLREALREMILVHVVDDDAWDQATETEQHMQRAIGAARSRITAHLGATHNTAPTVVDI
ncbi:MAG: hypothetical protein KGL39_60740 [Patescibacteria group bacterium]|nr:hypothetical protein [Patescibacteria group bacterium]